MIDRIQEIPKLPQVSMELIRQAFSDEPDIQEVAAIIERDPAFTAKLFKTVNSAAFGQRVEVTDVPQAISTIGLAALRSTIVTLSLGDYFIHHDRGNALNPRLFCTHSLATAVIVQEAAQVLSIRKASPLYLLGLLHDLGKFALDSLPDTDYGAVIDLVLQGESFEKAEKALFGWDNRKVWDTLARDWGFPREIIALFKSELETRITMPVRTFIEAASGMADTLGYGMHPALQKPSDDNLIFMLLDEKQVLEVGKTVKQQVEIMSKVLNLPLPDEEQVSDMLLTTSVQLSQTNIKFLKTQRELKFRVHMLEELAGVFTGIIRTLDGESLIFSTLESLIEGFQANGVFLLLSDTKGGLNGYKAQIDAQGNAGIDALRMERDQFTSIIWKCIKEKAPLKVPFPKDEVMLGKCLPHISLAWLVPIYVRNRFSSILGIGVSDENNYKFNSESFGKILKIVAGQIGLSIENAWLYKRMQKRASVDPLTHMNNRRTIMEILATEFARYKRNRNALSVVIFDMDHFKSINDARGHLAGDEFLVKAAAVLNRGLRESDYIGRYGGDEFIAVLPETTPQEAYQISDRLRRLFLKFCRRFEGPDLGTTLSLSVGVAGADPDMTQSDELILHADNALYQAKAKGRNHCILFNEPQKVP